MTPFKIFCIPTWDGFYIYCTEITDWQQEAVHILPWKVIHLLRLFPRVTDIPTSLMQLCLHLCWNIKETCPSEQTCFKREIRSVALIYAGGCICVLVMLLTKTLLPCTHCLQPKHFPKLQQRPGTVASILLLHLRAPQPRSSVPSILEDKQVREDIQEPFSAAANVVLRHFYTTSK